MNIEYDTHTALIVVDLQNDFADPSGALHVPGGEDVTDVINREIAYAHDAGATIAYTQDWHPAVTPHFVTGGGIWPVHCVAGTWGAELVPELEVVGPVVRKGTGGEDGYSGFTVHDLIVDDDRQTELAPLLKAHDVTRVITAGLATDYCVKETALDARRLGFDTVVLTEAARPVDRQPGDGARALDELAAAGVALVTGRGSA